MIKEFQFFPFHVSVKEIYPGLCWQTTSFGLVLISKRLLANMLDLSSHLDLASK